MVSWGWYYLLGFFGLLLAILVRLFGGRGGSLLCFSS